MQKLTLGQQLAQADALKKQAAHSAAAAMAAEQDLQKKKNFQLVHAFFESVKETLTSAIQQGVSSSDLTIQVGGIKSRTALLHSEPAVTALLNVYRYDKDARPESLGAQKAYGAIWEEFERWAHDQGLAPSWAYAHDGVGIESWLQLTVKPTVAPPAAATAAATVEPSGAYVVRMTGFSGYLSVTGNLTTSLSQAKRFSDFKEAEAAAAQAGQVVNVGVHETHCCSTHGCKYGDSDCPVASGELRQLYDCEECVEDIERYNAISLQLSEDLQNAIDLIGSNASPEVYDAALRNLKKSATHAAEQRMLPSIPAHPKT